MECCATKGIYDLTGPKTVAADLKRYRKKGPDPTTQMLLEAITNHGVKGMSLLDIGGGVGTIQHELIKAGVGNSVSVEASVAYNKAAKEEAERQGHADRIEQLSGDFVEMAGEVPEMDIVTLDRVICCYNDMDSLVSLSTERAKKLYGVVYPRDHLLSKIMQGMENIYHRLRRSSYRGILHPVQAVDALIKKAGFKPIFDQQSTLWKVVVYSR